MKKAIDVELCELYHERSKVLETMKASRIDSETGKFRFESFSELVLYFIACREDCLWKKHDPVKDELNADY